MVVFGRAFRIGHGQPLAGRLDLGNRIIQPDFRALERLSKRVGQGAHAAFE
jgi:hypothetical protein